VSGLLEIDTNSRALYAGGMSRWLGGARDRREEVL
jgi:hypothetical protein